MPRIGGVAHRRHFLTFRAFLGLLLLPTAASAQPFTTLTEWPVPTVASEPLQISASGKKGAYFSERSAGKVGFLDMNKNVITEWALAAGSRPHGVAPQGRKVAVAEENGNIAVLDPNSGFLTEWPIGARPFHVAVHGPFIYFTDNYQGLLGAINTSSNEITEWPMPPLSSPNGLKIVETPSGIRVWAAHEFGGLTMFDPATNTFTDWFLGGCGCLTTEHLDVAADGTVVFTEASGNPALLPSHIGMLDPTTNLFSEWIVPTYASYPADVTFLAPGLVAFTEFFGNKVGILDVTTPAAQFAVTPTVTTVSPTVFGTGTTTRTLPVTVTSVTPKISSASVIFTGGFAEYLVPTASSGPSGVSTNSDGDGVLFTESSSTDNLEGLAGNSIGLLH